MANIDNYAFALCDHLESINIPKNVVSIGKDVFTKSLSVTIYCEAERQPSGWNKNWNPDNRPVAWTEDTEPLERNPLDAAEISDALSSEIRKAYHKKMSVSSASKPKDLYIGKYHVTENGDHIVVVCDPDAVCPEGKYLTFVGKHVLTFGSNNPAYLYKNGAFYDLEDAYDGKLITEKDAAALDSLYGISYSHIEFEDGDERLKNAKISEIEALKIAFDHFRTFMEQAYAGGFYDFRQYVPVNVSYGSYGNSWSVYFSENEFSSEWVCIEVSAIDGKLLNFIMSGSINFNTDE